MKKLIDELEAMARKLFRNPNANDDTCKGFDHALQIVSAHNPWHEVTELPEMRNKDYSMRVMVVNSNGRQCFGYFYLPSRQWFDTYDATEIIEPAKWAYLPEVKP